MIYIYLPHIPGEAQKFDLQQGWPQLRQAGQELRIRDARRRGRGQDARGHLRRVRGHLQQRPEVGGRLRGDTVRRIVRGKYPQKQIVDIYIYRYL